MRQYILELLHIAHLGIEKTKSRARANVYWSGISGDIESYTQKCKECQQYRYKNPKETFITHRIPGTLGQRLGPIYLSIQVNYLLLLLTISQNSLNLVKLKIKQPKL